MSSKQGKAGEIAKFFQNAFSGLNSYVDSLQTLYTLIDGETLSESLPIYGTIMVGYLTCIYGITYQYNSNIGTLASDLFVAKSSSNGADINDYNYAKNQINKAYYQTLCTSTFILFFLIIIINKYIKNAPKGKTTKLKKMEREFKNIYKGIRNFNPIREDLPGEENDISNTDAKKKLFGINPVIGNPQIINAQDKTINIFSTSKKKA
tara:strand:+ start:592 stop:1212 length:621 start_codon:yes stop_codon:yes gene_type:complete